MICFPNDPHFWRLTKQFANNFVINKQKNGLIMANEAKNEDFRMSMYEC